jgi:hypothetical protein
MRPKYRFFIVWPMKKGARHQKTAACHFCAASGQVGETLHRKLSFVI